MELASRVYAYFAKIRPYCSGVRASFDVILTVSLDYEQVSEDENKI